MWFYISGLMLLLGAEIDVNLDASAAESTLGSIAIQDRAAQWP
jgi:uncharacterized BrkB/YihY/UPF0761 family membrane protein